MKKIPILFKEKELCNGCTACYAICPVYAIDMKKDNEGFEYPEINAEKCIVCKKCISVCPVKSYI